MSKRSYLGHAANIKQVNTLTIANTWTAADTITLTIANIDVLITIGSLITTAQVAQTVYEAFTGNTFTDTTASVSPAAGAIDIGQFYEIEASVSGSVVTLKSRTAGVPFTITATESTASTGTATMATATSATGASTFGQADNWSANTVPVDADDIVFEQGSQSCQDGLTPAIQPGEFQHWMTYTGWIGRPEKNKTNSAKPFTDYRTKALTFDDNASATATYKLGMGTGQGAEGIRLDFGAGRSNVVVYNSKQIVDGIPNITLAGTNANNTLVNLNGTVGVAFYAGESTTLLTLTNGQNEQSNAQTVCGPDATLGTVTVTSGRVTTNGVVTTVNVNNGEYIHNKGNITTLTFNKGTAKIRAALTVTNATISGFLDLSESSGTVTFTNAVIIRKGARIFAPNGNIVFSAGYTLQGCAAEDVKLHFGLDRTQGLT